MRYTDGMNRIGSNVKESLPGGKSSPQKPDEQISLVKPALA